MAKKSQKHTVRHCRDQSGCMWGLISIFDFRHGRSTQKLLSDRRPASRHVVGSGTPKDKTEMLPNPDENCPDNIDDEETTRAATGIDKPSVKKLIEKEMFTEQDAQNTKNAEAELKQSDLEHGSHKRKIRKNMHKSRSQSCDIDLRYLNVDENLLSQLTCLQNPDYQCKCGVAINEMMEEFCRLIQQKSNSSIKCDQYGEVQSHLNLKNPEFEEKLREAINCFVSKKLINEKNVHDAGDNHPSKELRDTLQILISDEELFLKLLQGPKSVMLKYVQSLCNDYAKKDVDTQVPQDRESKSLAGSKPSEGKLCALRQSDRIVNTKEHKFFRRRSKSLEKIPSNEFSSSQTSNTIVILKPGPTEMQNSESDSSLGSLPQSQFIIRNKGPNERVGSYFSLAEIKRKLKHAMGKERQEVPSKNTSKRLFPDFQATRDGDKGPKEIVGRNSSSKDHFFVEKIARPPIGVKKGQKPRMLKECETVTKHDTTISTDLRVSNIYIEAKKHLSEMLGNGNENVDFSSRQTPKPLGKILSLPDCNVSPMPSPGRNQGQSLAAAEMKLSVSDKFQKQESNASHLIQIMPNSETQSSVLDDNTDNNAQSPSYPNSNTSCELPDIEGVNFICSMGDEAISEVDLEIVESAETVLQEEINILDLSSQASASCTTRLEQSGDLPELSTERGYNESLRHDSCEENELPSSPLISPSTSPVTRNVKDLDCVAGTPDRQSPVSVLEPLFPGEDISPACIRSQPVGLPMQLQRIQFEDYDPSAADESSPLKISGQLLDPLILDAVDYSPSQLCLEKELLFDCINEVLIEVLGCYFGGCPRLLFAKPTIRPQMSSG
uniref:DUF3741 domain-containing protein n=1 Tax=Rhizophora mucronata TaxID=61149 RepID=A0A2P2MAE2_RHIMU